MTVAPRPVAPEPVVSGPVVSGPVGSEVENVPEPAGSLASTPVALVDLLDRVLATGVVVTGELTLSIAEVDLVHISLRALLSSVRARVPRLEAPPW